MAAYVIDDLLDGIARWGSVVRVVVTRTHGSTPRDPGAYMIVSADDFCGTIGGGKLELLALEQARDLLNDGTNADHRWARQTQNFVLGTELRQCCGGVAWLLFEYFTSSHRKELERQREHLRPDSLMVRPTGHGHDLFNSTQHPDHLAHWPVIAQAVRQINTEGTTAAPLLLSDDASGQEWFIEPAVKPTVPLIIYGAGHVGRALVRIMEGTPFDITWVDTDQTRFPSNRTAGVTRITVDDQAQFAGSVSAGAFHVVMTYSHAADLEICRAVLKRDDARYLGLIASKTKKAKFLNRLRADNIGDDALRIFRCPIGLAAFTSKEPSVIAISIGAQLIAEYEQHPLTLAMGSAGETDDYG